MYSNELKTQVAQFFYILNLEEAKTGTPYSYLGSMSFPKIDGFNDLFPIVDDFTRVITPQAVDVLKEYLADQRPAYEYAIAQATQANDILENYLNNLAEAGFIDEEFHPNIREVAESHYNDLIRGHYRVLIHAIGMDCASVGVYIRKSDEQPNIAKIEVSADFGTHETEPSLFTDMVTTMADLQRLYELSKEVRFPLFDYNSLRLFHRSSVTIDGEVIDLPHSSELFYS